MKRLLIVVTLALLLVGSILSPCLGAEPSNEVVLIEEKALLMEAIIKLSLQLNDTDRRLQEMTKLYAGAEEDVIALANEAKVLEGKLAEAMKLYLDAEADVNALRAMTERLTADVASKDAVLAAFQRQANAKAFLAFLGGALGGAAAIVLLGLVNK